MTPSHIKLNQAIALHQQGQSAQAKTLYEEILSTEPRHVDALHLLGLIAIGEKNFERAVLLIDKAIAVNPNQAAFYCNRGMALQELKQFKEAVKSYDRAIARKPDYAMAYSNRGFALQELKQFEAAIESFNRAIAIKPDYAVAYSNRGNVLQELKQFEKALKDFDRAIAINPNHVEAHFNRGNALHALGRLEEAVVSFDHTIALKPDFADAYLNRGLALFELKQFEAAIANYDQALAVKPDSTESSYNKGLALLAMNNIEEGWQLYESRYKLAKIFFYPFQSEIPCWDGEKLAGSLLVLPEQGLGDAIFGASMLNDLQGMADHITACVDSRLISLYQRSFMHIEFISRDVPIDKKYDAQIHMTSLGRFFRTTHQSLRDNVNIPYLKADATKTKLLKERLSNNNKLICGLSWVSKNIDFGFEKTLQLSDLTSILELDDIEFVDLQYGDTHQEQEHFYAQSGIRLTKVLEVDNFNDIDGLAALISACDVVLTISNTTAHLAGALGKKVIIMLPYARGLLWYWHQATDQSHWYPTATLIRQSKKGDWAGVIADAKLTLGNL